MQGNAIKSRDAVARVAVITLLATILAARAVIATTFMSVEPIPGGAVVGEDTLAVIESGRGVVSTSAISSHARSLIERGTRVPQGPAIHVRPGAFRVSPGESPWS